MGILGLIICAVGLIILLLHTFRSANPWHYILVCITVIGFLLLSGAFFNLASMRNTLVADAYELAPAKGRIILVKKVELIVVDGKLREIKSVPGSTEVKK